MPAAANLRRALVFAGALSFSVGLCESASAQSRRPPRRTPPPSQPTQPPTQPTQPPAQPGQLPSQPGQAPVQTGQPPAPGAATPVGQPPLEPSPYIKRVKPNRLTLDTHIFIGASQWLENQDGVNVPKHDTWQFDAATLVFPVLPETASSILEVWGPETQEIPAVSGTVELEDRVLTQEAAVLAQGLGGGPLPCGTWRAQWQVEAGTQGSFVVRELEFNVKTSQVCYETVFDERGASELEWPAGPWPADAAACFQPQMFVDFDITGNGYDPAPIAALVQQWTEGKDPHTVKPVVLAKFLAGKVLEHVQINGEGLTYDRTGLWQGFDTLGASEVAATGRGTEVDLPCLLVAVYRAVGIPARLVIGFDKEGDGDQVYLKKTKGAGEIRIWTEFCLYDEANHTVGWVPVDILQLRERHNRMPPNFLSSPTEYFGTHDELDNIAPIAFHFHPPTTVRSYGAPAFWGWFVTPTPPRRANQRVEFDLTTTPRGGKNESHLPARFRDK